MIKRKSVFIVGAGASKEVGLPVGSVLAEQISQMLDIRFSNGFEMDGSGDEQIVEILRRRSGGNVNKYLQAAWKIRDNIPLASSIDSFMDSLKEDPLIQECGKLAIAKGILSAERNSLLYVDYNSRDGINFASISDTWFVRLFRILREGVSLSNIDNIFDNVRFIVFNYDRCIEHFIYNSIVNLYGLPPEKAAKIIENLDIVHPYGTIGVLPWQDINSQQTLSFGGGDRGGNIDLASRRIKTYTEQIDDDVLKSKIGAYVENAEHIYFLGFSYNPQNLELLRQNDPSRARHIIGTSLGLSHEDQDVVSAQFDDLFGSDHTRKQTFGGHLTCNDLISEYGRTIGG